MRAKDLQEAMNSGPEENATSPSQLYADVIRTRPQATDTEKVLAELSNHLEQLAHGAGLPVKEFLSLAERSTNFSEDYLEALSTARQIARLKATR